MCDAAPAAIYDRSVAEHRTHYEVLRVARDADAEVLRSAYVRQARRFHPDVVGGDLADISEAEREMRSINAAWEVLGDPERRRSYDRTLPSIHVESPATDGDVWADATDFDDPRLDTEAAGPPMVGMARVVVRLAPLCFVVGFGLLMLGAVLQVSAIWSAGLAVLLLSMLSFLLAPFLVMGSNARRRR